MYNFYMLVILFGNVSLYGNGNMKGLVQDMTDSEEIKYTLYQHYDIM